MTSFLWSVFETSINILEAMMCMHFVVSFLEGNIRNRNKYRQWLGGSILLASVISILNWFRDFEGGLLIVYVAVIFGYSIFFYHGNILKKLFASVFVITCITTLSTTVTTLITTTIGVPLSEVYSQSGGVRILVVLIVQTLDFYVFQVILRIFGGERTQLKTSEWTILFVVFILSLIIVVLIQLAQIQENMQIMTRTLLFGAELAVLLTNVAVLKLVSLLNEQYQMRMENKLLQTKLQYQTQYTSAVCQQEETVRKLRHDMKNTLTVLAAYAEQKNTESILKYVNQYCSQLGKVLPFVHTNMMSVDAIINTKLSYAHSKGIHVTCRIDANLPEIAETDYCSLLGNMLDNGIEASEQIGNEAEMILEIAVKDHAMRIRVKNRISESVLKHNPHLYTTKKDRKAHGYGIPIIREIVSHYEGDFDYFEEDNWFIAQAVLRNIS